MAGFLYCVLNTECPLSEVPLYTSIVLGEMLGAPRVITVRVKLGCYWRKYKIYLSVLFYVVVVVVS